MIGLMATRRKNLKIAPTSPHVDSHLTWLLAYFTMDSPLNALEYSYVNHDWTVALLLQENTRPQVCNKMILAIRIDNNLKVCQFVLN